jgi:hypothetical protein
MSFRSWPSKKPKVPPRAASAADVGDDVDIAARNKEVARPGFDKAHRRTEILDLARVRRRGDQDGITARCRGTKNVGEKINASRIITATSSSRVISYCRFDRLR